MNSVKKYKDRGCQIHMTAFFDVSINTCTAMRNYNWESWERIGKFGEE